MFSSIHVEINVCGFYEDQGLKGCTTFCFELSVSDMLSIKVAYQSFLHKLLYIEFALMRHYTNLNIRPK